MVSYNEIPLQTPRMAIINQRQTIPSVSENIEKLEPSYMLGAM